MTNWTIINEKYIDTGCAHVLCDNAITAEIICAIHNAQIKPVATAADGKWFSTDRLPVVPPGRTVLIYVKNEKDHTWASYFSHGDCFPSHAVSWRYSK